jgi:hypothetical protein
MPTRPGHASAAVTGDQDHVAMSQMREPPQCRSRPHPFRRFPRRNVGAERSVAVPPLPRLTLPAARSLAAG